MTFRDGIVVGIECVLFVAVWLIVATYGGIPDYLLPHPSSVYHSILSEWSGALWPAILVTSKEVLLGLCFAVVIAFLLGVVSREWRIVATLVYPFAVTSQVVPKVAIVPLLLIWFGNGLMPKVVAVALIAFFPVLQATVVGLNAVSGELIDVMKAAQASRFSILVKARIPNALFQLTSAFRLAAIYGVVGAITAEFVGSNDGLGYLILLSKSGLETSKMIAVIIMTALLGLIAWMFAVVVERLAQLVVLRSRYNLKW